MKTNFKLIVLAGLLMLMAGCVGEKEEPEWYLQPGDALPDFEVVTSTLKTGSSQSLINSLNFRKISRVEEQSPFFRYLRKKFVGFVKSD